MVRIATIAIAFMLFATSVIPFDSAYEEMNGNFITQAKDGKTLYVGGSGPNNYSKIQDAINNASNGDTIFVYSGIYYENVVINKSINLFGETKETTIIDGEEKGNVIYICGNGVHVSNFTIQHGGGGWPGAGIFIRSSDNVISNNIIRNNGEGIIIMDLISKHNKIRKNTVVNNTEMGIDLFNADGNIIKENSVLCNGGDGITIADAGSNTIEKNVLSDTIYLGRAYRNIVEDNSFSEGGIRIWHSSGNKLLNNTINGKPIVYLEGKTDVEIDEGAQVILVKCKRITIKNFTITGSYMPDTGIYIFNSTGNKIFDCILENNGMGILMKKSSQNLISRCDISHGSYGIYIEASSGNRIYDCKIHNNFDGLFIESFDGHSCNNSIEKCDIYSNDDYGIELSGACDTHISNTNISNNRYGLGIYSSINASISDCKFINDGIHLEGDGLRYFIHKMENVTINGKPLLYFINQQGGYVQGDAGEILLINCSDFLIKNLSIENADVGIEIVYGQSNKIENCKIYGNDDCGILIINSSYNEICKCKIKSKYGYGLHAINSFKNSIHDNEFIKNGIKLLYSNNNSITNNTIDGKYILQIGMRIDMSKRNFIAYNNITGCWDTGIVIASRLSIDKNIIYRNNFYRNGVHAIWIADSFANMIAENNFIEHPVTASFENAWNVWLHNYWDGWRSPIPKPIYGYIEGFGGTPLFPLINFDWHPALKPFGGRK